MSKSRISAAVVVLSVCGCAAMAVPNPEIEPNENKAAATLADSGGLGLTAGDTINGTTTGTTTSTAGPGSADFFLVKMAPAAVGIYRHQLVLTTTGAAGHLGQFRGLTQNNAGQVVDGTNTIVQSTSTSTTPARFNQWYGFGKQELLFYRVSGDATTTAPYTATLRTVPVTPLVIAAPLVTGAITLTTPLANLTPNTAIWVYDSNFDPIPDFSNDDPAAPSTSSIASLTRVFTPGRYYAAFSSRFLSNNVTTPSDERFRTVTLTDFPGSLVSSASAFLDAPNNFPVTLTHLGGTVGITGTRGSYEVVWVRFDVASPIQPTPIVVTGQLGTVVKQPDPNAVSPFTGVLSALVVPGDTPVSTGMVVTANLAALGGPTLVMADDGAYPDVAPGDNIWSVLVDGTAFASGTYAVPVTASDSQGRTTTGPATLVVRNGIVPLGNLASGAALVGNGAIEPGTLQWFTFTPSFAADAQGILDVFTSAVAGSSLVDTVIGLYSADGTLIAKDDDDGSDLFSALSFGRSLPWRAPAGNGLGFNGRDGLLAGNNLYYIVVCEYRANIQSGFFATTNGQRAGPVRLTITGRTAEAWCLADVNGDGIVDGGDFIAFVNSFATGNAATSGVADLAGGSDDALEGGGPDGIVDGSDFVAFINAFAAGC